MRRRRAMQLAPPSSALARRRRREALAALDWYRDLPAQVYEDRAGAIRKAFRHGATITEIADRLNVGRKVIYDVLRGEAGHDGSGTQ